MSSKKAMMRRPGDSAEAIPFCIEANMRITKLKLSRSVPPANTDRRQFFAQVQRKDIPALEQKIQNLMQQQQSRNFEIER